MKRDKLNKKILFLLLVIFTITLLSNFKSSRAVWQTETIEHNRALAINMRSCTTGMIIEVQYNVKSGPGGVDAYLTEGIVQTGWGVSKPDNYLIYRDNSMSDNWTYEVPSDNDYSVQFFNDYSEDIVLRFSVQTNRTKLFLGLYISLIIAGPVIGAIVAIIVVKRRKKKKRIKSIETEPNTST